MSMTQDVTPAMATIRCPQFILQCLVGLVVTLSCGLLITVTLYAAVCVAAALERSARGRHVSL
jgi:hypothetical protein